MANMIKFYRGLVNNLPATGENGALYITTDEGAIYYGTGTGMKRLGDFIQVANVASLPEKAHESCLYYCVAENILAKWNGTEWKQINKQPTAEEMKTLLGLGSMAYKSTVVEGDLSTELAKKINDASAANHGHDNKTVLDGITAEKVTAWDAAEKNAKDYADGLNTAMNTRVEALEAIDHEHANKALLDTYTQTEADLADAVSKKHSHANAEELAKFVDGDKAKYDAVVADHLTSADKTTLENSIKEAKKAGTDANTNIETYKVANDARVLAVEEDIAEITGENGILAQAKSYSDGKLATARTEISAEIDADVKVVADDLAGYKTSNDAALAGVKATAEAAATKVYTDEELAKKVDKVEGKSLVLDTEITKLAGVSEGANKVEASANNGSIKIDGVETVVYTHPEKHAIDDVTGLQDALDGLQAKGDYAVEGHKHVKADITDFAHTHVASEITDLDTTIKGYDYATKAEAEGYANAKDEAIAAALKAGTDAQGDVDALEAYVGTFTASEGVDTVVKYIDAKTANIASDERVNGIDNRVKAIEDDYLVEADKTELAGLVTAEKERAEGIEGGLRTDVDNIKADYLKASDKTELSNAIVAEKERAEGIEGGLRTDVDAIKADYLKTADKTALQDQITANANAITALTDGIDPDKIDGLTDLVNWANTHAPEVEGIKNDIEANTKAIADQATADAATYETKTDASAKLVEAKEYADGVVATEKSAREAKEAELSAAIETAKTEASNQDTVVLAEAQKYADAAKADAIADAASKYEAKGTAQGIVDGLKLSETYEPIGAEDRAIAEAGALDAALKEELQGEIDEKANSADVYTKAEVEALLTWGSF